MHLFMYLCRCIIEDEPRINLKKTKYRKVSEFLHQYTVHPTNLRSGILVISETDNVQYVESIIRHHDCWRDFALNIEDAELFRQYVRGEKGGVYWNPSRKHLKGKSGNSTTDSDFANTNSNSESLHGNQRSDPIATSFNILDTEHNSDNVESSDETNLNTYGHHVNKSKKYVLIEVYKVPKNFLVSLFSRSLDSEFGPMLKPTEVCC